MPAARALRMAGTTPGPAGIIRMVETPDATAVSMAMDWTSSEVANLGHYGEIDAVLGRFCLGCIGHLLEVWVRLSTD